MINLKVQMILNYNKPLPKREFLQKIYNGDIICFPSWVWHEVVPNETTKRRIVISGNITFTHYDD